MRNPFAPHYPPHDRFEFALIAAMAMVCLALALSQLPAGAERSERYVLDQQEMRGAVQ